MSQPPTTRPPQALTLEPVGVIHSPYREKFAVPRQPGLVTCASARLELHPPYNDPQTLRGIEQFSHLWLIFQFHECAEQGWHPTVRPPRLGGNERVGVFASRSPFRPNGLGLSVVELKGVVQQGGKLWLELGGIDLVDGTPILDIKPYVPYADSLPNALGGFAAEAPAQMAVSFLPAAQAVLASQKARYPQLEPFITQVLAQDPRPAYRKQQADEREYGVHLHEFNVRWQVVEGVNQVIAIDLVD
ncbi:MAG: tRNA (N6-threonylcarbamoyladenosine(37)-N6)-methyltransferase TrmO [Aeromonadaceae bacterium]